MAERLSSLAAGLLNNSHVSAHHAHSAHNVHANSQLSNHHHHRSFNPRSVSLDIRTPEELAAVNSFLISLGRDVTVTASAPAPPSHHPPPPTQHPASYFDTASLIRMGLGGLPGIETAAAAGMSHLYNTQPTYSTGAAPSIPRFSPNLTYASLAGPPSHQHHNPNEYGALYPSLSDFGSAEAAIAAIAAATAAAGNAHHNNQAAQAALQSLFAHHSTSPAPSGSTPPLTHPSPPSSSSTPLSSTPPYAPSLQLYGQPGAASLPENISFDALMRPSGRAPVSTLAPLERSEKDLRPFIRLRSNLRNEQRMDDAEDKDDEKAESSGPSQNLPASLAKFALSPQTTVQAKSGPVYPDLKLPSIHSLLAHRDSPPDSPASPPSGMAVLSLDDDSRSPTPSTSPASSPRADSSTVLPSLAALSVSASSSSVSRADMPETEVEQRMRHAEIIRDLLLYINAEFAARVGVQPSVPPASTTDVEMVPVA